MKWLGLSFYSDSNNFLMKISYSKAKGRISPHCITWVYKKKRHRKFFRTRIDALVFKWEKESELGSGESLKDEDQVILHLLSMVNQRLTDLSDRLSEMDKAILENQKILKSMLKPVAPRILKVSEASKVLRISTRKLYYLLDKGVFKRYKLPHTRTTFIKLEEVEKVLNSKNIESLLE